MSHLFTYQPKSIEPHWQMEWEKNQLFATTNDINELKKKPKYYVLDMFPYPSGAGLHVGHPEGYTATDVLARLYKMKGYHVLHPMGWDAFGLPTERAALREGMHPQKITQRNITHFKKQLKELGFFYDWSREITTSDPSYYRWTQWIFLKLFEKGLAYQAYVPVNWCPKLGTVLANEEVKDMKYIETGDPVEKKLMKQWMLKITDYAEELLTGLDSLDWPEGIKDMQREWIGKSIGAKISFSLDKDSKAHGFLKPLPKDLDRFEVFTTRPETIYGVTFIALAPEHPLSEFLCHQAKEQKDAIQTYVKEALNKKDIDRNKDELKKTGIFTSLFAVHPLNQKKIPIYIADYVAIHYGTGAVMGVPAHDDRDYAFACTYQIPIIQVLKKADKPQQNPPPPRELPLSAFSSDLVSINSEAINGLSIDDAKKKILSIIKEKKIGAHHITYRLRDWLFSRQRYWGEPFPIMFDTSGTPHPVPESDLPIELPNLSDFTPLATGEPPLARAHDWTTLVMDGKDFTREINTMPQWAGSCWYYLRFLDPHNTAFPWDKELEAYWMPVDLYVGGVEHAVLHLLYARFWHKVLYDLKLVHTKEPFQKLFNQGMILGTSYKDDDGRYYGYDELQQDSSSQPPMTYGIRPDGSRHKVHAQIEKMSKSKKNVINPSDIVRQYGADALRLYELFIGPLDQVKPWNTDSVEGIMRFLSRLWRLIVDESTNAIKISMDGEPEEETLQLLHKTIKKVTEDSLSLKFNTAISHMMIFVNHATQLKTIPFDSIKDFLKILHPYAPHITEELWHRLGQTTFLLHEPWPEYRQDLIKESFITFVIQINGKVRERIEIPMDLSEEEVTQIVYELSKIQEMVKGKTVQKTIFVPNRLINLVLHP